MIFAKTFNHSQIIVMSLPKSFKLFSRILSIFLSNLPLALATFQSFRKFGHLFLKIKTRRLSKSKIALDLLRFLGKLCVDLLLLNKPLNSNTPNK
jgi:phosphatidylserine decarboxylase